ncbi:MAG: hypothetical protein WA419_20630 [Silvibacterium sp.]
MAHGVVQEFDRPELVLYAQAFPAAGADAEKGQIAPPREGVELAAGVGDSVDFGKRVGETGYAHRGKPTP